MLTKDDTLARNDTLASTMMFERIEDSDYTVNQGKQAFNEHRSSFIRKPSLQQRSTEIFECLSSFDINKLIQILSKVDT